jgi:tetratricopeptide (TPR) repeat protein
MTTRNPLTNELVDQRLDRLAADQPAPPPTSLAEDPYIVAAALRSTFEPENLPVPGELDGDRIRPLLEHSSVVEDDAGGYTWALRSDTRSEVFARLGGPEAILRACRQYAAPGDVLQAAIVEQLEGKARPLADQSRQELARTWQVTDWLSGLESMASDPVAVRVRLERELLLEPFRYLVGDHFAGRQDELQELSDYVGVRRAGSLLERTRRVARGMSGFVTEPPLVVSGVGGIGKSTLLAKFVLDHATLEGPELPFAYLDFDRSAIQADTPASLLIGAARQLAIQTKLGAEDWEAKRREWARKDTGGRAKSETVRDFGRLLADTFPAGMPFLLVLDTFEEVQYRSRTFVDALWDLLEELQESVHRLRAVIAGRAPIPERDTKDLELKTLDDAAAAGYLRFRGIDDPKIARFIVSRFGGNPLTLRLAADIVDQDEGEVESLRGVRGKNKILKILSAGQETVQRALYKRILDHIHDERVRALAHPGLALRRITSDLIVDVLAEPCGIELKSRQDADELLAELAREVSLVRPAEDGGVEHRSDLRRLMLPMLVEDHPAKVREIHDRAVNYYAGRETPADRAEEIYHRLARGDDPSEIEPLWMGGLEDRLRLALPELPMRAQVYLAPLVDVELDEALLEKASRRDRERAIERRARNLLALGDAKDALDLLKEAREREPGGPLDILLARAQYGAGDADEALHTIDRAIEELPTDAETRRVLELQELAARIAQDRGELKDATARLQEAFPLARWLGEVAPALALGTRWLSLQREVDPDRVPAVAAAVHAVLDGQRNDDVIKADPELAWELAGQLGDTFPNVVGRVGRAVAFPVDLPEDGLLAVVHAWAESDPAASGLAVDGASARRIISALFGLLAGSEAPPSAAAEMALLLRDRSSRRQ